MEDQLLTVNQVAEYLQVSRSKVYELIKLPQDPLPAIRVVGKASLRFSREKVDAWLAGVFDNSNYEKPENVEGGEQ